MTPLPTRRLGRTEVRVTTLGLGGAPLGNLFARIDPEVALATVRAGLAAGVGYFDTAPQYGHGRSEHVFGHVLREVPRESFVLSTKVGRMLRPLAPGEAPGGPWHGPLPFSIRHDYGRDAVLRSVEDSWQRLGMGRIDVALIHDIDRRHQGDGYAARLREALDGAVPALLELKAAGVIGAVGIGVNEVEPCLDFADRADLDCMMLAGRYTLLERGGLDELLARARARGFSLLIAGPFNSGILATGAKPGARHDYGDAAPEVVTRVRRLEAICAAHAVPLGAAALQFPLALPCVASVVTGAVRPEEIRQNAAWVALPLPAALWGDLRAEGLMAEGTPLPEGA